MTSLIAHPLSRRIDDVLGCSRPRRLWSMTANGCPGDSSVNWPTGSVHYRQPPAADRNLLHNRPAQVAALLGVLRTGATVVVINPGRGDERLKADVDQLALPLIIGEPDDLAMLAELPATTMVSISGLLTSRKCLRRAARTSHEERPGVAVRMLTSGTTGPPKRVDLTYDMLAHSVMGPEGDRSPSPTEPRRGVAIVNSPLVHIGGVFRTLQCVAEARPFVLLERFELDRWAEAVARIDPGRCHWCRPRYGWSAFRSASRGFANIRAVTSGTAPLSPDDSDAFTEKYGIPVLTSYAATEFGGGVAGWTLPTTRNIGSPNAAAWDAPIPGLNCA